MAEKLPMWLPGETVGQEMVRERVEARRAALEQAWDEGFTRGFSDVLAGGSRDASESVAVNPYQKED